jgi:CBS domain-containing protein
MIICPYCSAENIPGVDQCESCGQSLSDVHLEAPSSEIEQSLLNDHIRILNPKTPFAVTPDTAIGSVLKQMVEKGIGCVMVADGQIPVGIFSERDALLKLNTEAAELAEHPVSEFMTANPEMLEDSAKIAFAVQRMDLGGYRHVPIVSEDGTMKGVISVRDILRYLTERMTA